MIKMILTDIDGVLTDGRIVLSEKGELTAFFDVKDGHMIKMAQKAGLIVGAISGRSSKANFYRMNELGITELYQDCHKKLPQAEIIIKKYDLSWNQTAYIGDDVIDIPVLRKVGFSACPADAAEEVKEYVDFVSNYNGGRGALREIIIAILKKNGQWQKVLSDYLE